MHPWSLQNWGPAILGPPSLHAPFRSAWASAPVSSGECVEHVHGLPGGVAALCGQVLVLQALVLMLMLKAGLPSLLVTVDLKRLLLAPCLAPPHRCTVMYFTQGYWLRLFTNDAEVMQTFGECMPFVCLAVIGYRQAQGRRVCRGRGRGRGDEERKGRGEQAKRSVASPLHGCCGIQASTGAQGLHRRANGR